MGNIVALLKDRAGQDEKIFLLREMSKSLRGGALSGLTY